ncbi:hypothetical protein KTJ32_11860 [Acinetobacter gyllenbergii]|nr:hypothetical protein [Acinetobacter gyllenbergii]
MIFKKNYFLKKRESSVQQHTCHVQFLNSVSANQFFLRPKLAVLTFLFLLGCSYENSDVFLTKEIPMAKVGSPYYAEIQMKEYGVIEDTFVVASNIDQNSGLIVSSDQGEKPFAPHALTKIEGTPTKSGIYKINISGTVRDGLKDFDQDFVLKVEEE